MTAIDQTLDMNLVWLALSILFTPLLSFIICYSIKTVYSWMAPIFGSLLLLITNILAIVLFLRADTSTATQFSIPWFSIGDHPINISIGFNQITLMMTMVVTIVSFLVHLYSIGYMSHDQKIQSYFALLGFFTFSMIGLVLSNNLLLTFFFWELVGYSSYRLIGFWSMKKEAIAAATKSFIINRIADTGFIAGLMILYSEASLDLSTLALSSIDPYWSTAAVICIFIGVMGKSAQFPFFTWLPDAMEGPTPVSALIHAATMVAAGIFLLVRIHFLFTPDSMMVIASVGAVTTLVGAFGALFQFDIKKILAYSTISQLGLMILAIGCGSFEGGYLHLLNHAFFKAGLFLVAGSLIHSLHAFGTQDIREMGGLQKKLPITMISLVVCAAALAGFPFTSGFISKEIILSQVTLWAGSEFSARWFITGAAWLVTFLTSLYTFRLGWYLLSAKNNSSKEASKVPMIMRVPMIATTFLSIAVLFSFSPLHLSGWLDQLLTIQVESSVSITILSIAFILIGIIVGYVLYKKKSDSEYASFLTSQFLYIDKFYQAFIIAPILWLANSTIHIDLKWIDRSLHTAAYVVSSLAHVANWMDRIVIDKIVVGGTAYAAKGVGSIARSAVSGKIQYYLLWALGAFLIFMIALLYF